MVGIIMGRRSPATGVLIVRKAMSVVGGILHQYLGSISWSSLFRSCLVPGGSLAALSFLLLAVAPCLAAPFQHASLASSGYFVTGQQIQVGPLSTAALIPSTALFGDNGSTGTGYALADVGALHASLSGSINGAVGAGPLYLLGLAANAFTGGLVTFTCGGACGATTTVSLNIDVDGSGVLNGSSTLQSVVLTVEGLIDSHTFSNHIQIGDSAGASGFFTAPASGATSFSFSNATFSTAGIVVPVGVPVWVYLNFNLQANLYAPVGTDAGGTIDFTNTVRLSTSGPVFNLPAGYSANSTDLNIVDNQLQTIPEPGTCALAAIGLAILSSRYRKRAG
jgi:hypothetical protein